MTHLLLQTKVHAKRNASHPLKIHTDPAVMTVIL
jgi:hypothetical protein